MFLWAELVGCAVILYLTLKNPMPSSSLVPLICFSRQLLKKLCLLAHPSFHRHQPWHTSRPCSMPFSFLLSVYATPKSIVVILQFLLQTSPSVIFSKCKSSHPTTVSKIWLLQEKPKVPKLPHRVWLPLASLSIIHDTRNPMTRLHGLHLLQVLEFSFLSWEDPSVYLFLHLFSFYCWFIASPLKQSMVSYYIWMWLCLER